MEPSPQLPALNTAQRRRLRALWRSAGWPCQDMVEVELLAPSGQVHRAARSAPEAVADDAQGLL